MKHNRIGQGGVVNALDACGAGIKPGLTMAGANPIKLIDEFRDLA